MDRRNRQELQVVAVFAGTTFKLANYYRDHERTISSRVPNGVCYLPGGTAHYEPFYTLNTIGCVEAEVRASEEEPPNEYHRAVQYGRPLFSAMLNKGKLNNNHSQMSILMKILLGVANYDKDTDDVNRACLSVLATRVQMGQTSVEVLSELVSKGYAGLTCFVPTHNVTQICYFPDPVCARLAAMCLMDETWVSPGPELNSYQPIRGQAKEFWSKKLAMAFSSGLCRPS